MAIDYLHNLYRYNEWANDRVLEAASRVGESELRQDSGAGQGGVTQTLHHLAGAQEGWLDFWVTGGRRRERPELPENGALPWLRDRFARSHQELLRYIDGLQSADVSRELTYTGQDGRVLGWALWELMFHVANHSTQHRSEVAMALTALGSSPGDLDYGHFCDERASAEPGTLEMMRTLQEYNEWANRKLLAQLSGLDEEELMRPRGISKGSIGMDLLHLVGAQVGWLSIWQGGAPRTPLPATEGQSFGGNLIDWFDRSHAAIGEFVASLSDEELASERVDNPEGKNPRVKANRRMLLWDMTLHVVNHGTQHRSEVAMALTSLGRSPGDLDLLDFVDERRGQ